MARVSVVIPAFNESGKVRETVLQVREAFERSEHEFEIIVVDDGSTDGTAREARRAGAQVIGHPLNIGYGNSIRTAVENARYPLIALTDADGTYPVRELPSMASELEERDLDMIVGARKGRQYHGSLLKFLARCAFKFLGEFTTGQKIRDINSGLRVMRKELLLELWNVLCGGFSFTTTVTVVALLTNRFVDYRPIEYRVRAGQSKVKHFTDTLRTAQILVMAILMFNPIKLYLLIGGGVLAAGFAATLIDAIFPPLRTQLLIASLFFLAAATVMAIGFSAEQRRVGLLAGRTPKKRRLRKAEEAGDATLAPVTASGDDEDLVSVP